jgi:hypothetical protein
MKVPGQLNSVSLSEQAQRISLKLREKAERIKKAQAISLAPNEWLGEVEIMPR